VVAYSVMYSRRQSFNRIANPERISGGLIVKEPANSVANAEMITRALGPTPWFWSTRTLMKCDAAAVPKFILARKKCECQCQEQGTFYSHDD